MPTGFDSSWYYVEPDELVRPGNIFERVPMWRQLRPPLVSLGSEGPRKGKLFAQIHGKDKTSPVPQPVLEGKKDATFAVKGTCCRAILLTRGCDVEKRRFRQLALVRPLTELQSESDRAACIEGRCTGLHYLPETESGVLQDSYADFRHIVTLHRDFLDDLPRVAALSREGLHDLYFSWMTHVLGKRVPATTDCTSCGTPIPVFAETADLIEPPVDF